MQLFLLQLLVRKNEKQVSYMYGENNRRRILKNSYSQFMGVVHHPTSRLCTGNPRALPYFLKVVFFYHG